MASSNQYIIIFAILVGLLFVCGTVYFVNKLFIGKIQDTLTKVVVLILASFSALWVVDKLVFPTRNLLQPEVSKELFDMIKGLIILVFGVHFGTKKNEKEDGKL